MSVLIEAISVIVPRLVLEAKYPGGVSQYEQDCPNGTYCADEHLSRVGFMAPPDARGFIEGLEQLGFIHVKHGQAVDLVVVDQFRGPTTRCDWIEGGRYPNEYSAVWLAGTIPGGFVHPSGWRVGQSSKMHFTPNSEVDERFVRLAREKNLETLLDYKTGKQVYVGRVPSPSDKC
jgi:hypothetical protein